MKFTYDVRIDPDSVSDRLALILDLDLPAGAKPAELRDQNGISLGFIDAAGGGLQLPSLGERARGKWYRREFDLSHLTGGWIVSLRLFAGLPKSDGPAEGRLKFYLDNPPVQAKFAEKFGVTPASREAVRLMSEEGRAKIPTSPDAFKKIVKHDPEWINANQVKMLEAWNTWIQK